MTRLHHAVSDYLALRRALGFKLADVGDILTDFAGFMEREGTSLFTTQQALRWARQRPGASLQRCSRRLGVLRQFARHWSASEPRIQIPPEGLLPFYSRRKPPYIYSDDEVARMMNAAQGLPSRTGLRASTYSTLFGLLAVTGMRGGEARRLDREDVDLTRGVLTVRRAKFGKARLVPVHKSCRIALRSYAALRDRLQPCPRTPILFVSESGIALSKWAVLHTFRRVSRQIGLRKTSDHRRPRLHDLRHRFAVLTLLRWYRADVDVERRLPVLSTYLGHSDVAHTYWYLTATPELLRLVVRRLERPAGGEP